METNIKYSIVGIFILSLSIIFVVGVVWLSSDLKFKSSTLYLIYMNESVTGLNIDAAVEYNGVNVGSVKKIEIDPKNPQRVLLLTRIDDSTPITVNTEATLNTRGVTGLSYIALKDNGDNLQKLKPIAGQKYAIIKSSPSIFTRLDTALSGLSVSLVDITKTFHKVFDDENQLAIKQTLKSLQSITSNMEKNNQNLETILSNSAKASAQLQPTLNSFTTTLVSLQNLSDTKIKTALSNIEEFSNLIKNDPSVLIKGVKRTNGPGE